MSKQYDNTNRGVLFKNGRKETDKHPDYTGKIDVGGTEYKLAAWIKDGAKGKFMSLSVSVDDGSRKERSADNTPPFQDSELPPFEPPRGFI